MGTYVGCYNSAFLPTSAGYWLLPSPTAAAVLESILLLRTQPRGLANFILAVRELPGG